MSGQIKAILDIVLSPSLHTAPWAIIGLPASLLLSVGVVLEWKITLFRFRFYDWRSAISAVSSTAFSLAILRQNFQELFLDCFFLPLRPTAYSLAFATNVCLCNEGYSPLVPAFNDEGSPFPMAFCSTCCSVWSSGLVKLIAAGLTSLLRYSSLTRKHDSISQRSFQEGQKRPYN